MAKTKAAESAEHKSVPERRHSYRVHIAMPVLVRGCTDAESFEEQAHTISVSSRGCMLAMETPVTRLQKLTLVHTKTAEELPCTVTFLGQRERGTLEVGIKFDEPSPVFWRIAFPPEEWDPSERKRPAGSQAGTPEKERVKR